MIVLDTNVVSEPLRPKPDRRVLEWLDRQSPDTLYLTAVTAAELWAGIARLPVGKRRTQLQRAVADQVLPLFKGRLLDFDAPAAESFGEIHARAKAAGNNMDFADCAIAAIAARHGCIVATRDLGDFAGTGVGLLNPWEAAA